jgi:trimethylamine--corrinoid protein Co-methyltransferase
MPIRPSIKFLTDEEVKVIYEGALEVLESIGIKFYNDNALEIFKKNGAEVDEKMKIVKIPRHLVKEALKKTPKSIKLYSIDGKYHLNLEGDNVYFGPGSVMMKVVDDQGNARDPILKDAVEIVKLIDVLDNIHLNGVPFFIKDVPEVLVDRYRMFITIKYSNKPVAVGAFTIDGPVDMREMLVRVVGSEDELVKRPRWILAGCPSPPLKWSKIAAQNVIDCARFNVPVIIISVPQLGVSSPATIAGALVQHTAETLSGITLIQLVNPGAPVIYGGSPTTFDMRYGNIALGSIETTLISCGYAQIGKYFGLPIHGYAGVSDSKIFDAQAGMETGMNVALAALAGINVITVAGMLESESAGSFQKFVFDNEIFGEVLRMLRGIEVSIETLALNLFKRVGAGGEFIKDMESLRLVKKVYTKECYIPSAVIDRKDRRSWEIKGSKDVIKRANDIVKEKLAIYKQPHIPQNVEKEIIDIIRRAAKRYDVEVPKTPTP